MEMGFRMTHSLCNQPKVCNPSISPSPVIKSPHHDSRIFASSSNPSDFGCSTNLDPLVSKLPACEFPSLHDARRLSVKARSGVQASRVFECMSVSPATPFFQSDFCREVVGARHSKSEFSVNNEIPCVKFSPSNGFPAIPNLEFSQHGQNCAEDGSTSAKMSSEELKSEGSGCCLDVDGSTPVDLLPVQDSTVKMMHDGAELLPAEGLSIFPTDSEGMVEGLPSVSQGAHLDCHPVDNHGGQIKLPHQGTRTNSGEGLPSENAGGSTCITRSSVVTKNTHGGHDAM